MPLKHSNREDMTMDFNDLMPLFFVGFTLAGIMIGMGLTVTYYSRVQS